MNIPLLVLGLPLAIALALPTAQASTEYPFLGDLNAAEELSKSTGKPLLALFR